MPWRELVAWAEVPRDVVEQLEREARERGSDPDHWWCCPTAIPRTRWRSIVTAPIPFSIWEKSP